MVDLPIMLANFDGWARFYRFSQERGMDFGSPWYALSLWAGAHPGRARSTRWSTVSLLVGLAGVVVLAARWRPDRPGSPRWRSSASGVFVLTNKVYSPQYVLWVLPLAVLARPRWRDLLLWQLAEATYFVAIWWYLVGYGTQDKGLHYGGYALAVGVHWLATAWLMGWWCATPLRRGTIRCAPTDDRRTPTTPAAGCSTARPTRAGPDDRSGDRRAGRPAVALGRTPGLRRWMAAAISPRSRRDARS